MFKEKKTMNTELWDKCKAFHGHECGGLTIGYKAALYAIKLLDLKQMRRRTITVVYPVTSR